MEFDPDDTALQYDTALHDHLVRVAQAAAAAACPHVGGGDKDAVDGAAVRAMRTAFGAVPVSARIVVGEGEKDEAPMLFAGEELGAGGPELEVAVDPVDGTRLAAEGRPGAVAVFAAAPRGALFDPGRVFYMEKLIAPAGQAALSLERPLAETLATLVAEAGKPVSDLRVAVQDRPRNRVYVDEARAAGAQVRTFADGDVVESVRAARGDDTDLLVGIGGAPEGVLTSVAVRAVGGRMQGRLRPQTDAERREADAAGQAYGATLELRDLVAGPGVFVLTAVTDAAGLRAPTQDGAGITTESLLISGPGQPRRIIEAHRGA